MALRNIFFAASLGFTMPAKLPDHLQRTNVCLRLPRGLLARLRAACASSDAPSQSDVAIAAIELYLPRVERKNRRA
jgi:hypothetical protein